MCCYYKSKVMSGEMNEIFKATQDHPNVVIPVPSLGLVIAAFKFLTRFARFPRRWVLMKHQMQVMIYQFGDASSKELGSTIWMLNKKVAWKSEV
jgi:hypothetical protein